MNDLIYKELSKLNNNNSIDENSLSMATILCTYQPLSYFKLSFENNWTDLSLILFFIHNKYNKNKRNDAFKYNIQIHMNLKSAISFLLNDVNLDNLSTKIQQFITESCCVCHLHKSSVPQDLLLICDNCNKVYHKLCIQNIYLPEDTFSNWYCNSCNSTTKSNNNDNDNQVRYKQIELKNGELYKSLFTYFKSSDIEQWQCLTTIDQNNNNKELFLMNSKLNNDKVSIAIIINNDEHDLFLNLIDSFLKPVSTMIILLILSETNSSFEELYIKSGFKEPSDITLLNQYMNTDVPSDLSILMWIAIANDNNNNVINTNTNEIIIEKLENKAHGDRDEKTEEKNVDSMIDDEEYNNDHNNNNNNISYRTFKIGDYVVYKANNNKYILCKLMSDPWESPIITLKYPCNADDTSFYTFIETDEYHIYPEQSYLTQKEIDIYKSFQIHASEYVAVTIINSFGNETWERIYILARNQIENHLKFETVNLFVKQNYHNMAQEYKVSGMLPLDIIFYSSNDRIIIKDLDRCDFRIYYDDSDSGKTIFDEWKTGAIVSSDAYNIRIVYPEKGKSINMYSIQKHNTAPTNTCCHKSLQLWPLSGTHYNSILVDFYDDQQWTSGILSFNSETKLLELLVIINNNNNTEIKMETKMIVYTPESLTSINNSTNPTITNTISPFGTHGTSIIEKWNHSWNQYIENNSDFFKDYNLHINNNNNNDIMEIILPINGQSQLVKIINKIQKPNDPLSYLISFQYPPFSIPKHSTIYTDYSILKTDIHAIGYQLDPNDYLKLQFTKKNNSSEVVYNQLVDVKTDYNTYKHVFLTDAREYHMYGYILEYYDSSSKNNTLHMFDILNIYPYQSKTKTPFSVPVLQYKHVVMKDDIADKLCQFKTILDIPYNYTLKGFYIDVKVNGYEWRIGKILSYNRVDDSFKIMLGCSDDSLKLTSSLLKSTNIYIRPKYYKLSDLRYLYTYTTESQLSAFQFKKFQFVDVYDDNKKHWNQGIITNINTYLNTCVVLLFNNSIITYDVQLNQITEIGCHYTHTPFIYPYTDLLNVRDDYDLDEQHEVRGMTAEEFEPTDLETLFIANNVRQWDSLDWCIKYTIKTIDAHATTTPEVNAQDGEIYNIAEGYTEITIHFIDIYESLARDILTALCTYHSEQFPLIIIYTNPILTQALKKIKQFGNEQEEAEEYIFTLEEITEISIQNYLLTRQEGFINVSTQYGEISPKQYFFEQYPYGIIHTTYQDRLLVTPMWSKLPECRSDQGLITLLRYSHKNKATYQTERIDLLDIMIEKYMYDNNNISSFYYSSFENKRSFQKWILNTENVFIQDIMQLWVEIKYEQNYYQLEQFDTDKMITEYLIEYYEKVVLIQKKNDILDKDLTLFKLKNLLQIQHSKIYGRNNYIKHFQTNISEQNKYEIMVLAFKNYITNHGISLLNNLFCNNANLNDIENVITNMKTYILQFDKLKVIKLKFNNNNGSITNQYLNEMKILFKQIYKIQLNDELKYNKDEYILKEFYKTYILPSYKEIDILEDIFIYHVAYCQTYLNINILQYGYELIYKYNIFTDVYRDMNPDQSMKYKKLNTGIRKYRHDFLQSPYSHIWNLSKLSIYRIELYDQQYTKMIKRYDVNYITDGNSLVKEDKESGSFYIIKRNVFNSEGRQVKKGEMIAPNLEQTTLQNYFSLQ